MNELKAVVTEMNREVTIDSSFTQPNAEVYYCLRSTVGTNILRSGVADTSYLELSETDSAQFSCRYNIIPLIVFVSQIWNAITHGVGLILAIVG